jgi:hypothetical protein
VIAIVGSGLAALCAYTTLRWHELEPEQIVVFGLDEDPAATWHRRAAAIRQREMRSESDGHCLPSAFPGLAVREWRSSGSLRPLVASLLDRYHPTVDQFLAHVEETRTSSGWDRSIRRARVGRITLEGDGFAIDGHGPFRHVLVATGHPKLNIPAELADDPRAVHAYEEHEYAGTVTVVGAGLAAATEWLNALAAGSEVVSVRRREPVRRPLNVPRAYFSKRRLQAFHRLGPSARAALLDDLLVPSFPPGRRFDDPLRDASREGRFRVAPDVNGSEQVICATGFTKGFAHDDVLRRLVADHELETVGPRIVLDHDSTVPGLTTGERTLALAGAPAQWAFPAADTLVGAKYAARRFAERVTCRTR